MAHPIDNAWKDILQTRFEEFLAFFFSGIHADIDWSRGVEFLDKELEQLVPEATSGSTVVDKLARVHPRSGKRAIVFIHVEVQAGRDARFTARMFRYNARLRDRYGDDVVSLAILTDDSPSYRPHFHRYSRWGFSVRVDFPMVKLLDHHGKEEQLERDRNPFAVVVLAHLARLGARDPGARFRSRWRLIRLLYERGHTRQEVRELFRFLDWILRLPRILERRIMKRLSHFERGRHMPYLSTIERWSIERGLKKGLRRGLQQGLQQGLRRGRQQGLHQGKRQGMEEGLRKGRNLGRLEGTREGLLDAVALCLECRFGPAARGLMPRLRRVESTRQLRRVLKRLQTAESLTALRRELKAR